MRTEESIQATAIATVQTLYPQLIISPSLSGVTLGGDSKSKAQTISVLKRSGFQKGIPDILIYLPKAKVLNLEFKRPSQGVMSVDQKRIKRELEGLEHNYYIVTTTTEVLDALRDNVAYDYRMECFQTITKQLDSTATLDKEFLFFVKGTTTSAVRGILRDMYGLKT